MSHPVQFEDDASEILVGKIADEFTDRMNRGERPQVEEYTRRHPHIAQLLCEVLMPLQLLRRPALAPGPRASSATNDAVPAALGEFRILRVVGRGGMGIVYEAEQKSLGRHVALKVLPLQAVIDPTHLERFQREARVAARLHHTNIVPVFGVGEQDGVYYYAMQFIRGQGLNETLRDLRRLRGLGEVTERHDPGGDETSRHSAIDRPARGTQNGRFDEDVSLACGSDAQAPIALVTAPPQSGLTTGSESREYFHSVARIGQQVAEALAYAHAQGVLHRDIKPSNLLLDTDGTVWVTDFGLAKIEETEVLTRVGDLVGTLRYMAPEQFKGRADERSDIYGLGLTLYELLTLYPAFDDLDRGELIRRVAQEEPRPPRRIEPRVPRDLETIVLKAIAKEPSHRYQSADEMAKDLSRFLSDRPIEARRATLSERAWRWCRRNPALATMTASLVVAFASGFAGVVWQWRRAEHNLGQARRQERIAEAHLEEASRQRARAEQSLTDVERHRTQAEASYQQARKAVDQLFATIGDEVGLAEPNLHPLRRKLLETALEYYQGFIDQRGDDPNARSDLATSYLRVAIIHDRTGSKTDALSAYQKAVAIRRKLILDHPENVKSQADLANSLNDLGLTQQALGQHELAHASYEESLSLWETVVAQNSENPAYREGLSRACNNLGYLLRDDMGRPEQALPLYEKSLAIRKQLTDEYPDSAQFAFKLALSYSSFGVFKMDSRSIAEAFDLHHKARVIFEDLVCKHPEVTLYHQTLGKCYNKLGDVHRHRGGADGDREAWTWYEKTREIQERLVQENPRSMTLQKDLSNTYANMGDVSRRVGDRNRTLDDWHQAVLLYRKAIATYEEQKRTGSDAVDLRATLGTCYSRLAWCLAQRGERDEAFTAYQQALEHCRAATAQAPLVARYRDELAIAYLRLSSLERMRGQHSQSVAAAIEARNLWHDNSARLYELTREIALTAASVDTAEAESAAEQLAARNQYIEHAIDTLRMTFDAGFTNLNRVRKDEVLKVLRDHSGYKDVLERQRRHGELVRLTHTIESNPNQPGDYVSRGNLYEQLTQLDDAAADFHRAIELFTEQIQADHDNPDAYRQRGQLFVRLGDFTAAVADFSHALERRRDSVQLLRARAQAYEKLKQWDQAIADYSRIIELNPNHPDAYHRRARLFGETGRHGEAAADYQQILKIAPDDASASNNLAWMYVAGPKGLRNPEAALTLAEKAVQLQPTKWMYLSTLGTVQYRLGQFESSIEIMTRATAANKEGPTAFELFFLAMSHHQLGDQAHSHECYDRAIAWCHEHQPLPLAWAQELAAFRAEAAQLLGRPVEPFDP